MPPPWQTNLRERLGIDVARRLPCFREPRQTIYWQPDRFHLLQNPAEALEVAFTAQARDLRAVEQARREVEAAERGGIGSVKNLGRYAASWIACWPKRPSSTAALT